MSEQTQLTQEQVREIHQKVPVALNLNLDQINGILFALGKAPLEFALAPTQMITSMTTPQVQAWDAQQAAKAQTEAVTDVEAKTPAANEAV